MTRPAFCMVVGPGDRAIALHSLALLRRLHASAPIWVRDDATTDGTGDAVAAWAREDGNTHVSRNSAPRGYHGIAKTLFTLFDTVAADEDFAECDFLVKLDPDALVCGTGYVAAVAELLAQRGPGLVGPITRHPSGTVRAVTRQRRNIYLDLLPAGPARSTGGVRLRPPFWRAAWHSARKHGYQAGVSVQGGSYAMHRDVVTGLHANGYWRAVPEVYRAMTWEEDTLVVLGVAGLGYALIELADADLKWWIQFRPPVPLTPAEVASGQYTVVHPLKDTESDWVLRTALAAAAR